jgi:hypothetical protein
MPRKEFSVTPSAKEKPKLFEEEVQLNKESYMTSETSIKSKKSMKRSSKFPEKPLIRSSRKDHPSTKLLQSPTWKINPITSTTSIA